MSIARDRLTVLGTAMVACAVCLIGPAVGVITALGISATLGYVVFGSFGLLVGLPVAVAITGRRQTRSRVASTARNQQ